MQRRAQARQTLDDHWRSQRQYQPREPFWTSLQEMAAPRDMAASTLVFQIDTEPGGHCNNLSSAIRVHVLRYCWFSVAISPSWPASKPDANSKCARE
jgi:predicted DNA-binding ribbon-helix-helix protein